MKTKKVTKKKATGTTKKVVRKKVTAKKAKLLSGGNPQIAKGDGDGVVQAYIAAMPGWKQEAGKQLDALITKAVPKVKKAIRWNSPFYGIEGKGWCMSFHCFNKYIKLAFLNGSSLDPLPPIDSKVPNARYFHIFENEPIDEKQLVRWIKQSAKLPGENLF